MDVQDLVTLSLLLKTVEDDDRLSDLMVAVAFGAAVGTVTYYILRRTHHA